MRIATVAGLLAFACIACQPKADSPPARARESRPEQGAPSGTAKVEFKDSTGAPICKLKPKSEGLRVYDETDRVLGEVRVQSDRVKLKDAQDVERIKIKRKDYGAEIETSAGERLYKIKRDGGNFKLEDASGITLVKCKAKAQGYEVRDAAGATIAKVKPRTGKLAFETEEGARLFELSGTEDARAGMWFALERFTLAERAALYAFFARVER